MTKEELTAKVVAAPAQVVPAPGVDAVSEREFKQFLSDVLTAAGLVTHGKKCKDLGRRLGEMSMRLLTAPKTAAAQAATAKQSPHPEYDKGFSDGWNRCEARQAAAPVQAAPVDAERLDYLQECGATVEVLPGRPGWTFRIGGLHGTVHRSVRAAIDAARAAQKGGA